MAATLSTRSSDGITCYLAGRGGYGCLMVAEWAPERTRPTLGAGLFLLTSAIIGGIPQLASAMHKLVPATNPETDHHNRGSASFEKDIRSRDHRNGIRGLQSEWLHEQSRIYVSTFFGVPS